MIFHMIRNPVVYFSFKSHMNFQTGFLQMIFVKENKVSKNVKENKVSNKLIGMYIELIINIINIDFNIWVGSLKICPCTSGLMQFFGREFALF